MKLKLMTFNIQHCRDYINRNIDIDLFVRTIKKCDPDIIGLNEIYGEYETNKNQSLEIAEKLGFHHYFGQAITWKNIPFGNAILSRYPFQSVEKIMIPDPIRDTNEPYETRCVIKALINDITVLVSHFGLIASEQVNAVKTVTDIIKNTKTKIILMGDFNMEVNSPILTPINELLKNTLVDDSLSYPSINPTKKIDYIYVSSNIEVLDAQIPNLVASDHLPHIATIKIN